NKASEAVTYSMDQLTQGVPASLKTAPFEPERAALRKIAQELRQQDEEADRFQPETIQKAKDVLKAARTKVEATYPKFSNESTLALNYIKALYGLLRLMQTPDINILLAGVDKRPDTTLGDLLGFMRAYNLRFGVSKTPSQREVYNDLYPRLVQLRD